MSHDKPYRIPIWLNLILFLIDFSHLLLFHSVRNEFIQMIAPFLTQTLRYLHFSQEERKDRIYPY